MLLQVSLFDRRRGGEVGRCNPLGVIDKIDTAEKVVKMEARKMYKSYFEMLERLFLPIMVSGILWAVIIMALWSLWRFTDWTKFY